MHAGKSHIMLPNPAPSSRSTTAGNLDGIDTDAQCPKKAGCRPILQRAMTAEALTADDALLRTRAPALEEPAGSHSRVCEEIEPTLPT